MATDSPPKEAKTMNELLELIINEKKRIRHPLYQPHLLTQMKTNVMKISDTLKYSIDKAAMLTHQNIDGMNELCPEISKYISILTVSVKIINYSLCECAANQLIKASVKLFDSIYKLLLFIQHLNNHNNCNDDDDEKKTDNKQNDHDANTDSNPKTLTTLVGVVWQNLTLLKTVSLDNITSIGRQIMITLTVIRDAKKEIKESIKDMEMNECIIKLNPWKYDYSKLESQQIETKQDETKQDNVNHNDNDNNNDSDSDFIFVGMEENELTEFESLRVYQIYECIIFVDEVINHIYLFIIKHFKQNINELDKQKKWLTKLTQCIALLPNYVDEISCCIYEPQLLCGNEICKNVSNLLHFLWKIAIEIAEESVQYKNRKMVIKNKKKKSKSAVTGYEWKCKFVDLNIKIGEMFGLLSMEAIDKFIENDSNYNKQKNKKKQKKKNNKNKKREKMRKYKKKKSTNGKKDSGVSASSQKEQENTSQADINDSHPQSNDDMIDID